MKKIIGLFVVVVFLVTAVSISTASTQDKSATPTYTIATVDLAKALNEVNEGKKAKANLEKEFKAKKKDLDKMKDEIAEMQRDLESKSHLLSQEALKGKQQAYQAKFMEYQQKARGYTEELARKEGEMTTRIVAKLRTVVEKIAEKDGYTYVLEKSQGGVVYAPNSVDITNQVIKKYNK